MQNVNGWGWTAKKVYSCCAARTTLNLLKSSIIMLRNLSSTPENHHLKISHPF